MGAGIQRDSSRARYRITASRRSWPSLKMSAETSSRSPTSRLQGYRPSSTAGSTPSIRMGRNRSFFMIRDLSSPAVPQIGFPLLEDLAQPLGDLRHGVGRAVPRLVDHGGHAAQVEGGKRLRDVAPVDDARAIGQQEVVYDPRPETVGEPELADSALAQRQHIAQSLRREDSLPDRIKIPDALPKAFP